MGEQERPRVPGSCAGVCGGIQVPMEDELKALDAMRAIKERVRDAKRRLKEITVGEGLREEERSELEEELAGLKNEWRKWDEKRKEAARKRMILLGHEEAD